MDLRRALPLILLSLVLSVVTARSFFVWVVILMVGVLIARPTVLLPVVRAFEFIARTVGTTISNLALGFIFIIMVIPYGYFYRAIERKLTTHFFDPLGRESYYTPVERVYEAEHFKKPW